MSIPLPIVDGIQSVLQTDWRVLAVCAVAIGQTIYIIRKTFVMPKKNPKNVLAKGDTTCISEVVGVHVFRAGLQLAALYGASVAIPWVGIVRSMRRVAALTIGPLSGRSITARLVTPRCDLACESIRRPIEAWVGAI